MVLIYGGYSGKNAKRKKPHQQPSCLNIHDAFYGCVRMLFLYVRSHIIHMANITLSIPDKLHKRIKKHSEIRWSEVARNAMMEYVEKLELLDELTGESELTDKDAIELSKKIKRSIAERHRALLK